MTVDPSPELLALGLAAILQGLQIGLAAWSMNRDGMSKWNAGPRDAPPQFSDLTGRLRRAVDNHFEALVFFIIAVVLVEFTLSNNLLTAICAWIYLGARVLYVPAYALGWTPWRSVIYAAGMVATMTMTIAALI